MEAKEATAAIWGFDVSFVLKALGYGAMGIAAIVLCLSYLLVRQLAMANPPRPPGDETLLLVQKYMKFALICTGVMVLLQISDQGVKVYTDNRMHDLERRVLGPANFGEIAEWDWQWAEGGWETRGAFMKGADSKYRFAATTVYKGCGGNEPIMNWSSTEPVVVSDDDSDIVFRGKRVMTGSEELLQKLKLGPQVEYPTLFTLRRSWALTGKYSGVDGGGPFGDIMLYAPRK